MPTYSYQCISCGHTFRIMHSIKEKMTICSECGGELKRLVNYNGYTELKGEGFHKNDYPKGGKNELQQK